MSIFQGHKCDNCGKESRDPKLLALWHFLTFILNGPELPNPVQNQIAFCPDCWGAEKNLSSVILDISEITSQGIDAEWAMVNRPVDPETGRVTYHYPTGETDASEDNNS